MCGLFGRIALQAEGTAGAKMMKQREEDKGNSGKEREIVRRRADRAS